MKSKAAKFGHQRYLGWLITIGIRGIISILHLHFLTLGMHYFTYMSYDFTVGTMQENN